MIYVQVVFRIRPFAHEFLKNMRKHFEIVIFTAATGPYAESVLKELDPNKSLISYVLDRTHCLQTKNGFYIKDLRIINNRDLKNIVMIDNLVHSFGLQLDNGIPILEWTGDKNDTELKYIQNYLVELSQCENIPEVNKKRQKFYDLTKVNIEEIW